MAGACLLIFACCGCSMREFGEKFGGWARCPSIYCFLLSILMVLPGCDAYMHDMEV